MPTRCSARAATAIPGVIELLCESWARAGIRLSEPTQAAGPTGSSSENTKKPEAQVPEARYGMKVMEDVPYITDWDKHLGTRLTQDAKDYLKDMGAALALQRGRRPVPRRQAHARGARAEESAVKKKFRTYVVDDAEMEPSLPKQPGDVEETGRAAETLLYRLPAPLARAGADLACANEGALARHAGAPWPCTTVAHHTTAPDVADAFRGEPGVSRRLARRASRSLHLPAH